MSRPASQSSYATLTTANGGGGREGGAESQVIDEPTIKYLSGEKTRNIINVLSWDNK